jgi:hypothetical protein
MTRTGRWIAGTVAALLGLLLIAAAGLAWWLPDDAQLAARVATEFEQRTGVGLRVGTAHWTLRPGLSLMLGDLACITAPGKYHGVEGIVEGLGRTRHQVRVADGILAVPVELGSPTVGQAAGAGGWHDFGGIIQGAIEDARINAERRLNPIECPVHGWPLKRTVHGLHCQFGGHVVAGG